MRYVDEFRDPKLIVAAAEEIEPVGAEAGTVSAPESKE